ncbi:MAG TPA: STAS domain-containing protein [Thermodesulfobacteriaceae bacterium]|nr:STAS domain-containing protein [Thermodesulfobacteriaceae bacterium]
MVPFSIFPLGDVLLVSIQEEIDDVSLASLLDLLGITVSQRRIRGVIVDLKDVDVVDSFLAEHLWSLASMLALLHAQTVIVGLSVPVVMTLLDFDIALKGVEFALDVEQALDKLNVSKKTRQVT